MNTTLFVESASRAEIHRTDLVLTNAKGDQLWRWFDTPDGKRQWKVWAVEPTDRRAIAQMKYSKTGAVYFEAGRHIGSDIIIPRRYLKAVAKRLGLDLRKTTVGQPGNRSAAFRPGGKDTSDHGQPDGKRV